MAYPKRIYSKAELKKIVEYYETHNITQTAAKFHIAKRNVSAVLISQNVKIKPKAASKSNICMNCKRAARFIEFPCPWASKFEPVEGWKAKKITKVDAGAEISTYHITKCPLFMLDD